MSLTLKEFLMIALLIGLTNCFLQTKYAIHDLATDNKDCFIKEIESWESTAPLASSLKYYDCAGAFILGGFNWHTKGSQMNYTLKRFYQDLPEHKYIRFTFALWKIDSWGNEDSFQLQFDSLPLFEGLGVAKDSFQGSSSLCGSSKYKDYTGARFFGWIEHTSSDLLLTIISKMDSSTYDESFGIRDLKLLLTNTLPTGPPICANAGSIKKAGQVHCPCLVGRYSVSGTNSDCTDCHEDCASCFGPGSGSCFECASGRYFDGNNCVKCHSGCSECFGPGAHECTKCAQSGYVPFNGKCVLESRCKSQMVLETCTNDCQSPCELESRSSWKENCFPPCSGSHITDVQADCIYCESLSAKYLKDTDSGHQYMIKLNPASCDLDIETVRRYIVVSEEIKGAVGPFLFEIRKSGSSQYFVNLILENSVLEASILNVKLSFLEGQLSVPKKFVPDATLEEIAKMLPAAKSVLKGSMGGSFLGSFALGASTSLWSIVSFQQFVGYFIYMNIEFPFQTELFLKLLQIDMWEMLPNPLSSLLGSLSEEILKEDANSVTVYDPPSKFVKYEMSSFFVENGGTIIAVNLLLLVLLWLVIILRKTKHLRGNFILEKIEAGLRWNTIARTFLENGIPLSLAVFLQLRVMTFQNLYLTLCCVFAIFSFFYTFGATLVLWFVLKRKNNQELKKSNIEGAYGTLYEGLDLTGNSTKYYNVVILVRGILIVCLVTFWETIPLFQIFPLILFNVCLVYYLFKHVPFEDKKLSIIVRIKEILILLAECCIFCLLFGGGSEFYYNLLGYLVLAFLSTALAIEFIYMVILQIIELKNLPKNLKKSWQNMKGFFNKCFNKNKHSMKTKHQLETTVVKIRPHHHCRLPENSFSISSQNDSILS